MSRLAGRLEREKGSSQGSETRGVEAQVAAGAQLGLCWHARRGWRAVPPPPPAALPAATAASLGRWDTPAAAGWARARPSKAAQRQQAAETLLTAPLTPTCWLLLWPGVADRAGRWEVRNLRLASHPAACHAALCKRRCGPAVDHRKGSTVAVRIEQTQQPANGLPYATCAKVRHAEEVNGLASRWITQALLAALSALLLEVSAPYADL